MENTPKSLMIGWASRDVSPPPGKVSLRGQFHIRVTDEINDPLTTTALALETKPDGDQTIIASLDAVNVSEYVVQGCKKRLAEQLDDFAPDKLLLSATHTHTAPDQPGPILSQRPDLGPEVLSEEAYGDLLIDRITEAAVEAWTRRKPGSVSWGRDYAVVGFNRRVAYMDGSTKMYGSVGQPDFSHIEGHEDHAVELLFTYDANRELTGMIANVPCPSQCTEHACFVSADYWHETRQQIRARHGQHVHILPQCSAAGDLSPRTMVNREADARMLALKGYGAEYNAARRQDIADKIADAVDDVLPLASKDMHDAPVLEHRCVTMELTRRRATESDLQEAHEEVANWTRRLEELNDCDPASVEYSKTYRRLGFNQQVIDLYHAQQKGELLTLPVELHVLRLGDIAMGSNRFEYYLDFGERIKARSPALQTFVVQLAGHGTYLPPERSMRGGSYGAYIASTPVGPEGGQQVVEATVAALAELFDQPPSA